MDNKSGIPFDAESLLKLIAVMLTLLTVYAARLSICILSSYVLKKSSLVTCVWTAFWKKKDSKS
ncbi:hypothetical protein [Paenibacillus sp. sgz500992]|uniref:hypothetical protein n=1 Tax=Paenibacillus sp. sgz500992 TaxID=3242476 RepID=UPI0036D298B0